MADDIFLFDTYALIEILNANPEYEKYAKAGIAINEFIFAEFCYKLYRENIPEAYEYIEELKDAIINAGPEIINEAMMFRCKNRKKNLSMTDCISYIMAKELKIKLLTGDKEFENLENVEFVK